MVQQLVLFSKINLLKEVEKKLKIKVEQSILETTWSYCRQNEGENKSRKFELVNVVMFSEDLW